MTSSSDTPRSAVKRYTIPARSYTEDSCGEWARWEDVERELAACNDQREVSRKMLEGLCELRDELKAQLAACREELAKAKAALTPLGCTSLPESQAEIAAKAWTDEDRRDGRKLAEYIDMILANEAMSEPYHLMRLSRKEVRFLRDSLRSGALRVADESEQRDAERWRWLVSRINYRDETRSAATNLSSEPLTWHVRAWTHDSNDFVSDSITATVDAALREAK